MSRRFRLSTLLLLSLVLAGCRSPAAVTPIAAVGMTRRHFVDTLPILGIEDSATRPIETTIWYPATATARPDSIWIGSPARHEFFAGTAVLDAPLDTSIHLRPLIVLSHGTGGSARQLMWLGQALAARGFLVAAVDHHGNTSAESHFMAKAFALWWARARDLSAVLDAMLSDSTFGPRVDASRIGAAGFSLGGYTVIEVAGGMTDLDAFHAACRRTPDPTSCDAPPEFAALRDSIQALNRDPQFRVALSQASGSYRDTRVKSVFAIAPALGAAFTPAGLSGVAIPVQMVVGDSDFLAPAAANAQHIAQSIHEAKVQLLAGVGHYTFLSVCTGNGRSDLPLLCHDPAGTDREAIHRQVADSVADFFFRSLQVGDRLMPH